ncbi:MAG: type 4a pilus biogenesis protein PilO [Vicinamibacteria bacterium]|nr:type 4a pilus biogenesis protein PilO [Vicinamibacteria bacterium]
MWLALASLLAVLAPRPFTEERELLDRRLAALRRILPDEETSNADSALVKELAKGAQLSAQELGTRPITTGNPCGFVTIELTAVGRFIDIDRFFRQVALSHRLIDVESVSLTAAPEDMVHLKTNLRFPFRAANTPLPAAPEDIRARVKGIPRQTAQLFERDHALSVAKTETIVMLKRTRRNPRLFLAEMAAIMRDRPVILRQAVLDQDFRIRGVIIGEGSTRALESRFERGFFRISEFLMQRRGGCYVFEVRGTSPVVGTDAELPLPDEDPFQVNESACRVDRDPPRAWTIKKTSKTPGKGPLTLRLREVDIADVFLALHILTQQGFLIDEDVVGRVNVDLARVTPEEILSALVKEAGLTVSGLGPIRRVSLSKNIKRVAESKAPAPKASPVPNPKATPTPTPARDVPNEKGSAGVSLRFKRTDVRDILVALAEIDPSLATLGPTGDLGRISLWVRDAPVGAIRSSLLAAVGLFETTDEGRLLVKRLNGPNEIIAPIVSESAERRLALRPQEISVREFELAGLAGQDSGWIAFSYSPTGSMNVYRAGDRLADGRVRGIESTDVVLESEDGALRAPLPLLR